MPPPMKTPLRSALLLVLAFLPLLFAAGCASIIGDNSPARPAISFADMELQGIKGLETIFRLHLKVTNPNDTPIDIRGLNCTLHISGKPFADGSSDEHITVPASGAADVPVTVYTTMFDLVGPVIELLQNGVSPAEQTGKPLEYALSGRLRTGDTGEDLIPFAMKGKLPPGR